MRSVIRGIFGLCTLSVLSCLDHSEQAGTSSGVDSPGIVVGVVDTMGHLFKTTGSLEIYGRVQNTIEEPSPLEVIPVENESLVVVSSDLLTDLTIENATQVHDGFNLYMRMDGSISGAIVNVKYDVKRQSVEYNEREWNSGKPIPLETADLPYVAGQVRMEHPDVFAKGIFIPGTPYISEVKNNYYRFENYNKLHEGLEVKVLGSDNRIYSGGVKTREELEEYWVIPLSSPGSELAEDDLSSVY